MIGETSGGGARIVDRGYQHYQGTRLGSTHAFWVMTRAAMRRAMGIRRSGRAKIMPWLLMLGAFVPVVITLAIRVMTPAGSFTQSPLSYTSTLGSDTLFFILFAGLAAPDLVCADRRERVLALYFAAPITRLQYPLAQLLALVLLLLVMTLGPGLALFIGNTVLADSAAVYLRDHAGDLGHLALAAALMAAFYGALAMAVAAFTDRRAYASGAFLGLMLVSSVAGGIVGQGMRFAGHERFILLDLINLPVQTARWIFGEPLRLNLEGWAYLAASLALVAVGLALTAWRYLGGRE